MRRRYRLLASLGVLVLGAIAVSALGWSPSNGEAVAMVIVERLPATIALASFALAGAVAIGAMVGFARARARAPVLRGALAVLLAARAVPIIVLALFLELVLAYTAVLPPAGMASREAFDLGDRLRHLMMPVLCLAVPFGAWMSIVFHDFFRAAGDTRTPARGIVRPVAASAVLIGPALLATTVIIEPIFAWPGIARLFIAGLSQFDFGIIAGCLVTYCAAIVLIHLVAGLAPGIPGGPSPREPDSLGTPWSGKKRIDATVVVATVVLLGAAFGALVAGWVTPFGPYFIDQGHWQGYPLAPGTAGHVLGTDENGRDLLARALFGLRTSLAVAAFATLVAAAIGFAVAMATKALRPLEDRSARSVIGIRAFAGFPFALTIVSVLVARSHGVHLLNPYAIALIIALVSWPAIVPAFRTLTVATLGGVVDLLACALLLEVTQSFLGFGVQPPRPSLGNLFVNAQSNVAIAPWIPLVPSVIIVAMLLALYALGDALRKRSAT